MKTAFVTDSGTGESMEVLSRDGIYSLPLQISCGEESYQDSVDITIDQVYEKMREGAMLSTSLPSVGKIEELQRTVWHDPCHGDDRAAAGTYL